ncbi:MAG: septation protein A [Gammaproteobacteria bacterium]|nr:septation protein A [Gammaproteobacteria bacterium]
MKFLFDFFPILLFFVAYKAYDIYVATAVAIVASFVQVGGYWIKHRRFENAHLITLAIVVVFGGATLLLQDKTFIQWKPTVVNWLFAVVFFGSQFIGKKNIVQRMLDQALELPAVVWARLNYSWVAFFIVSGAVNLYVMYNYDEDTWVNFKLFGMMGMTLLFMVVQGLYLSRHAKAIAQEDKP